MERPVFPFFSIVIPAYNRPEALRNCLTAMTQLDYPRDRFEVIVVDDGSRSPLSPVVVPFQSQLTVTVIRQPNGGPAKARNTGASQAKGEYLAFTDDDCAPTPTWLKALAACFANHPDSLIGGHTLNALTDNLYSTASQTLTDFLYAFYVRDLNQPNFFASNNFALPTDRFHELGGFSLSFPLAAGEDREFCDRWLQQGYPVVYAPNVQIHHAHSLTLQKFWRQHFNYGRGAFHFRQARASRTSEKVRVEPGSFYYNMLTYPFSKPLSHPALLISALFVLSQVANVSGFFWERQHHRDRIPLQKTQDYPT